MMDRRRFLTSIAIAVRSAVAFIPFSKMATSASDTAAPASEFKAFSKHEAETLGAICEQIVPTDDYPGARASGVPEFIDHQLAGSWTVWRDRYREGLKLVDYVSQERFGQNFRLLLWEQQTALLQDLESGKAAGASGTEFFSFVKLHTMQGYYGDPRDGANRNGVSWKMINFAR